jgi:hypothetical protein
MTFIDSFVSLLTVDQRHDVTLLRWPEDVERADRVLEQPTLWLLSADAPPPDDWDALTDWIRLPADPRDVRARVDVLLRKARAIPPPEVDQYGVLRNAGRSVNLSPIEARMIEAFLAQPGTVLTRPQLGAAGWTDRAPNLRSVDSYVKSLRRRIAPLDLSIETVRRHGYMLHVEPPS